MFHQSLLKVTLMAYLILRKNFFKLYQEMILTTNQDRCIFVHLNKYYENNHIKTAKNVKFHQEIY